MTLPMTERHLKVISCTINDLVVCSLSQKHSICNVRIHYCNGGTCIREKIFLLSYSIGTVIWCDV